jgi:hypothetical protein
MPEERNIFQKIGDAVTDYAPGIAGILALVPGVGTTPAAALGAVAALGKAFGLGTQAKPEDVLTTIQNMPDSELKLKFVQAENDYQLQMVKTTLADVQNARQREVDITKVTGKKDLNLYALSWVITIGFFISLIATFVFKVPTENKDMMTYLVVTLQNGTILAWSYYYGSSAGSSVKTDLLAKAEPIKDK